MVNTTPCIRCGKLRVVAKTWTEKTGVAAAVTYTQTVCPDPACQKLVEKLLQERNDRFKLAQELSLKRKVNLKRKRTDIVLR